jgi:hypothetical protein
VSFSDVHLIIRHSPFLKASHPTFSGDAVLIRLTTIGSCGRNLTYIALQFVRSALPKLPQVGKFFCHAGIRQIKFLMFDAL